MRLQRISFETAKLAKKKGFDIGDDDSESYTPDGKITFTKYLNTKHILYAPSQHLLQKWLREEYFINVQPMINYVFQPMEKTYISRNTFTISIMKINSKFEEFPINTSLKFKNYEKALEFGLKKALKLIV